MRAERASAITESKAKHPRNLGGAGPKLSEMRAKFRNEIWAGPKRNSGLGQMSTAIHDLPACPNANVSVANQCYHMGTRDCRTIERKGGVDSRNRT